MFAMILSFFFMSCGSSKQVDNTTMQYELDTIVDRHFIDSVCIADTLAISFLSFVLLAVVEFKMNSRYHRSRYGSGKA